jgi:hypothetical protein
MIASSDVVATRFESGLGAQTGSSRRIRVGGVAIAATALPAVVGAFVSDLIFATLSPRDQSCAGIYRMNPRLAAVNFGLG